LHHPLNGSPEQTWTGFSWPAFFFGIFWLLVKGLYGHFLINLLIVIFTGGIAAPIVWIAYGCIGNEAYRSSLLKKGYLPSAQQVPRQHLTIQPSNSASQTPRDHVALLRELTDLRDRGALTNEEFDQQKKKLLGA